MNRFVKKTVSFLSGLAVMLTAAAGYSQSKTVRTEAAASKILAFPGAVGGGKYATGGRGGEVVHVTNLNDSGAGSFRDAVSKSGRIVVFDVSGTIELASNIICQSNITIAGQTAPGGSGITLKNYKFGMGGDNIIVRYIGSRPGPDKATSSGNDGWGGAKGSNSIIDHCSIGWTTDEQWGLYSNNNDYTCQYSVIGPANSWGGHVKGIHGFGLMFGRANFSFDHNLIIHNVSRNFRGKIPGQNAGDFTNNIIYDWGYQTTYGTIGHVNYVNNTLKAGNSTTGAYHYAQVSNSDDFKLYLSGNRILNKDGSVRNAETSNWSAIDFKSGKTEATARSDTHFPITINGEDVSTSLTAESASASFDHVVAYAGNGITSDSRTAIDKQCAEETKNGTGQCSGTSAYDASQSELNKYNIKCGVTYSYPAPVLKKTIKDTDNDGMPDDWEKARGLDPNNAADAKGDYCGQGYNNIEYYINDLTVNSFPQGVVKLSPSDGSYTPSDPVDPVKISAFDKIEAESFDEQSGVKSEPMTGGGEDVGYIENGDYIAFKGVDFGDGAKSFTANLAGNAAKIELHLDRISDKPAAVFDFQGTGNWQTWKECSFNVATITGVHSVYLKFTSENTGYLLNIDYFTFRKNALPVNGRLIKNFEVKDTARAASRKLADNSQMGDLIFGDRDFKFTAMPDKLVGSERIATACDSKNSNDSLASFTAGDDITVYIAFDNRLNAIPSWAAGYEKTADTLTSSNDVTFDVYKKDFKNGEAVDLGTNGQSYMCVNYAVFVKETDKEPVIRVGDIDMNGVIDMNDLDILASFLIKRSSMTAEQGSTADINKDGKLNVFDLILIKRSIR